MRAVAIAVLAAAAFAQDATLPPEVLLLARVKQKALANLERLPDYVCTQTVERFTRKNNARDFKPEDRVTFDLAFIGEKELYAWPGTDTFSKETPTELLGYGMSNTGPFGLHVRGMFNYATIVRYAGGETISGRRVARYNYKAPAFASPIRIGVGGRAGDAGSRGSFWVDPDTHDILRIEVHADDIPAGINVGSAVDRVDYARVNLGSREVLLPSAADMEMTDLHGNVSRNVSTFTACRQYTAASSISFSEPAESDAPPRVEARALPPNLPLTLALESEIDAAKSGVGSVVRARVTGRSGPVPQGALVTGRVLRIVPQPQPVNELIVAIGFTEIEYGTVRAPFTATLVGLGRNAVRARLSGRDGAVPGRGITTLDRMPELTGPGVATIYLPRGHALPKGFVTRWRTGK